VFGLIGSNGVGKTTTIKILMNILKADSGEARILGVPSVRLDPDGLEQIGYVSENQQLPGWMTIDYLLRYLKPFYPAWDSAYADALVQHFKLPRDRKLSRLSRGMWMKTALLCALAYHPRLLVLDEPFSGLDPLVREDLIEGLIDSANETTEMVSFFFSTLIVIVAGLMIAAIPAARVVIWNRADASWPHSVTWVRSSFVLALIIVTAVYVLAAQYMTRRTGRSRVVGAGLLVMAVIANFTVSPGMALELHSRFSERPPFASQIRVGVDAQPRRFAFPKRDAVQISIPLRVSGVPAGVETQIDAMQVTFEASTAKWETLTTPSRNAAVSEDAFDAFVFVTPSFFTSERERPLKLSGSLFLTVYGRTRSTAVTLTPDPINVGDGLQ